MNERLQQKILSNIIKDDSSECWLWKGQISNSGYGKLKIKDENNRTKMESAQQVSYMAFVGPIAQGLLVKSSCDNRLCVNPDHLKFHKL